MLRLLLLLLMMLCDGGGAHAQPLLSTAPSPGDVTVFTEEALLSALGAPVIHTIRMAADITMQAHSVIPGAPPSSGVYLLSRNVTITVTPGTNWYPTQPTRQLTHLPTYIPTHLTIPPTQ